MIIFFISVISFILALVHFVIYKTIVAIFSISFLWRIIFAMGLTVLCLSFVLASILTFNFNNLFTRILYTFSATWLGFAFYLFLASCVCALTTLVFRIFDIDISLQWFGVVCLALAVIVSIYGTIHARKIVVRNITVPLPNLPTEWQGKKAVYVSDVHLGAVNGQNFSRRIVDKINEINPDIVFIGGDLYDGVKVDELEIIKPFGDLHPALGTYFVTGNHEEFRDNKHYLNNIESIGIRVLDDQMVTIDGLQLVGVGDRDSINPLKTPTFAIGHCGQSRHFFSNLRTHPQGTNFPVKYFHSFYF